MAIGCYHNKRVACVASCPECGTVDLNGRLYVAHTPSVAKFQSLDIDFVMIFREGLRCSQPKTVYITISERFCVSDDDYSAYVCRAVVCNSATWYSVLFSRSHYQVQLLYISTFYFKNLYQCCTVVCAFWLTNAFVVCEGARIGGLFRDNYKHKP